MAPAWSNEFSIAKNSTVIGQNYGYPSATTQQGPTPIGQLDIVLETAFFAKNLELIDLSDATGIVGETLIGSLLPIRGRYRAHRDLTIELGGVFGQNFGDRDSLDVVEPLARLVYEPQPGLFVMGGTLMPTHWIHDALHDDVQVYRTNTEQGFQSRIDRDSFKHDTWINWCVREHDNAAEEFEVGSASQLRFCNQALWVDGQLFFAHAGGQKNNTDRVENNRTLMTGVSYGIPGQAIQQTIREIRLGIHALHSYDELSNPKTGHGVEYSVRCDSYPRENLLLRLFGSHFTGSDYSSWRGDPLYQIDQYSQIGLKSLYAHASGFSLETGIVGQYAENLFNYTFMVNFIWGQAFRFQGLTPR
jgi:hypothetical protein